VRIAGLQPLPRPALRLPPLEDRVPRLARVARCDGGQVATARPRGRTPVVPADGDPALAGGLRVPVLPVQPVQALGVAERAEGVGGGLAFAPRRLAAPPGPLCPQPARSTTHS